MDIKQRNVVLGQIEEALDNMVTVLEENRFYPSEREAGTAPNEAALDACKDELVKLVCSTNPEINESYLLEGPTLDQVIAGISSNNEENTADDYDCLTEIDTFVRDNGERKYEYFNTVYQFRKTDDYISVEEQRSMVGGGDFMVCDVSVTRTTKKEKVTYEWS